MFEKEKFRISIIYDIPAAEVCNGIELIIFFSFLSVDVVIAQLRATSFWPLLP